MSREDYDRLTAQGLLIERVGDLIGGMGDPIAQPCPAPRLPEQPLFPTPGIYFGMPEEEYHAIPACSTSGLKKLSVSNMDFWANSWLNPDREETTKAYFDLGKAIHCFVLEGEEEYLSRFAVQLDQDQFDKNKLLISSDQIKAAIKDFGHKPTTTGFDNATVRAKKEDWIAQLLEINPGAMVWEAMLARHLEANEGKTMIDARTDRRIRIAVKMIMAHPEIGPIFSNGYPEVSIFWHCPVTGAPMKARLDYLKTKAIIDLKSFSNKSGMPIGRAIEKAIANYRYLLQQVAYDEAVFMAKSLVRQNGASAVHTYGEGEGLAKIHSQNVDWCEKWAKVLENPAFVFVFQQMGEAPVTRGYRMPRGITFDVTKRAYEDLKYKWVECVKAFGCLPWLDILPIENLDDEAIPLWATEF